MFGADLPPEGSVAGAVLEAEAVHAERVVAGESVERPALRHLVIRPPAGAAASPTGIVQRAPEAEPAVDPLVLATLIEQVGSDQPGAGRGTIAQRYAAIGVTGPVALAPDL